MWKVKVLHGTEIRSIRRLYGHLSRIHVQGKHGMELLGSLKNDMHGNSASILLSPIILNRKIKSKWWRKKNPERVPERRYLPASKKYEVTVRFWTTISSILLTIWTID